VPKHDNQNKPSVVKELIKGCLHLFWTWIGFDALAEDFATHENAVRKAKVLRLLLVVAMIFGVCGYMLKGCFDSSEIREATKTIGDLRYENGSLRTSNSTYEVILDPVRKVAHELHPEMEMAAAVGRLADDLQQVRSLATKDLFRPLDQNSRSNLVAALRQVQTAYGTNQIRVTFTVGTGKTARLLADEWVSILNEAGLSAYCGTFRNMFSTPPPPDVLLRYVAEERSLAETFARAMQGLVLCRFNASPGLSGKGVLAVEVNGEPLFLPNGRVVFK